MARCDYMGIEQAIQTQLRNDANLSAIFIADPEQLPTFDPMGKDAVYIYLESRSAPEDIQRLRHGTATNFLLQFSIWCFAFHADEKYRAAEARDDLVGNVELALMSDRTLQSTVDTSWLEGGVFESLESGGFWAGAEIILMAQKEATT